MHSSAEVQAPPECIRITHVFENTIVKKQWPLKKYLKEGLCVHYVLSHDCLQKLTSTFSSRLLIAAVLIIIIKKKTLAVAATQRPFFLAPLVFAGGGGMTALMIGCL